MNAEKIAMVRDPLLFFRWMWPDQKPYRQQCEVIQSVNQNDETYVPAGNMLGA